MTAKPRTTRFNSTQEPLDDEECRLMDPETWDFESTQAAIVEPSGNSISEVRLAYDELVNFEAAAIVKGMTVNAYMHYAALQCARQHAGAGA